MWHRVGLVRTGIWEGCVASIFRVERISELRTSLSVAIAVAGYSLILFTLKEGGDTLLRNIVTNKAQMEPNPRRLYSSRFHGLP
jgi:hypothetical protein